MAGDPTALYLERYAEPEARDVRLERRYDCVLVVPAFDESPDLLDGLEAALRGRPSLCIVVVNAAADAEPGAASRTRALVAALCAQASRAGAGYFVDRGGAGDLWIVDRASPGSELPRGEGVGLARKIGMDAALAAAFAGRVGSPWIHSTDADAVLGPDYFAAADTLGARSDIAALVYPFWHRSDDSCFGRALCIYECSLRYYVLGLAAAGSPYAFHSIGSCLAARGDTYAVVRGVPRRQAGEDFYLLNKLAKEGHVAAAEPTVELRQRESQRTPFGTGERAATYASILRAGGEPRFYHPELFNRLREVLAALSAFAVSLEPPQCRLPDDSRRALEALGIETLVASAAQDRSPEHRAERARRWFDGFRTLRFLHELERYGYERLPWHHAIDSAPFCPASEPRDTLRRRLAAAEADIDRWAPSADSGR